jgi:hypothetical protein
MSQQSSSQQLPSRTTPPLQPPGRRRGPPSVNPLLLRRPGPPSRMTTAPAASSSGGRLRDVSLASLLEGVDQVPSARKRLIPAPSGVLATGASRPGVMQSKIPQR